MLKQCCIAVFLNINVLFCLHKEAPSLKILATKSVVTHNHDTTRLDCDTKEYVSLLQRNKNDFKAACYEAIFLNTTHLADLIALKLPHIKSQKAQKQFSELLRDCAVKAIFFEKIDALKIICPYVDVNQPIDKNNTSLLMLAAYNSDGAIPQLLLDYGANIRAETTRPVKNVLIHAASANNKKLAKCLIGRGVDINEMSNSFGFTALKYAVKSGATKTALYLLTQSADVNKVSKYEGETPLDEAVKNDNKLLISELLLKTNVGKSTVDRVIRTKSLDIFRMFFDNLNLMKIKGKGCFLHACAQRADTEAASFLLSKKLPINKRDNWGNTPLHEAMGYNNLSYVKLLLEHDADVHIRNNHGITPFSQAILFCHTDIVDYLLTKISIKALIADRQDEMLFKGLHKSLPDAYRKDYIVEFLKKLFATENLPFYADATNEIPLKILILHTMLDDDIENFKTLCEKQNSDFNEKLYHHGTTLLEASIFFNAKKIFDYLLSVGADPNICDHFGQIALNQAAKYTNNSYVQALLKYEVSVDNRRDEQGPTPLMSALRIRNLEVAATLIEKGADVNANDFHGSVLDFGIETDSLPVVATIIKHSQFNNTKSAVSSALNKSVSENRMAVVSYLLENVGIDEESLDKALRWTDDEAMIKLLLKKGINPLYKNYFGQTALMEAAREGRLENVKTVLNFYDTERRKQLLNDQCSAGLTALICASDHNYSEITELCLKHGTDVFIKDNNGQDALIHARLRGNRKIESIIKKAILQRYSKSAD